MTKLRIGLIFISIIVAFACKKKDDDSVLGLDVQPENDLLGVTISDTSSVYMFTQKVDSVKSYNDQYKYLGSNQDPIFGRTDASIYTNFSIANNLTNLSFGANPVLDSAEMVIRFIGESIGDTTTLLNYDVYVLNQNLSIDRSYYSTSTIPKSYSKVCSLYGKLKIRNGNVCLILPFDDNLAQYILQTNSNLANNTGFQNAYKGFYITTSASALGGPGSGAIRQFDLDDDMSGVTLYYHDSNSASSKGQKFQFTFRGADALRFNHITHNYVSGASLNLFNQITGSESTAISLGNSNVYLNCFGGTRTKVYFPYVKNFSDSQIVSISRAELIIKVDENISLYDPNYIYPPSLALIACGADGAEELVYDQLETTDFVKYGGTYDATNKQYVFNIARQMQKIVSGSIANFGFYLVNALPNRSYVIRRDNRVQRLVFGGRSSLNYKPIFKVTYIKFPYDK